MRNEWLIQLFGFFIPFNVETVTPLHLSRKHMIVYHNAECRVPIMVVIGGGGDDDSDDKEVVLLVATLGWVVMDMKTMPMDMG